MRKSILAAMLMAATTVTAFARDTTLMVPLQEVLDLPEAKAAIDGSVKFYMAGANTPKVASKMGEGVSNKKTNGAGKDDRYACKWAALSALISLQGAAKTNGANAVVDIVSYYKRNTVTDPSSFECHAGGFVVGVTLKGTYAKI
jgi:uncharacterized protein YbjQ (UPF0145 family)